MKKPKKERSGECQELVGSWKRHSGGSSIDIPVNWERVMIEAAQNPDFKESLIANREQAIARAGFRLSDSENAMLAALSPETLEVMIRSIDPGRSKNRRFARTVATAAMVGGMLIASHACEEFDCGGIGPDIDSDNDTDTDTDIDTDTDTDTDIDTDTDTDTDTGVDPDAGNDSGSDAG